jgi:hypothetical protein
VAENTDTIQENTKALLDSGTKIANRSFKGVAKFKYKNCVHEEIKCKLNSGNACYHSVHSALSSRLLSRKVKVKIDKTTILPVVFYGCETFLSQ